MTESIGTPLLWAAFTSIVLVLLAVDVLVVHRKPRVMSLREAGAWTAVWVSLALAFNTGIYLWAGSDAGLAFTTGYLVELALSVDNMVVFALIFTWFAVPVAYQHRVLFWGILGALVMRFIFVLLGAAMLKTFHPIIYIFGALLIFTGIKLLRERETHIDPDASLVLRLFRRFVPTTPQYHGEHFTIRRDGKRYATPLLAVLVLVEATDVMFAIDSVPAVFAITSDPFIVFTSNICAILGLRSLYFLLAGVMDRFVYLKVGLGAVLVFVGAKMAASDVVHVPVGISLGVVATLIGGSIVVSLLRPPTHSPTVQRMESAADG